MSTPPQLKYKCFYCQIGLLPSHRNSPQSLTKEHLLAKSNGGITKKENIVKACQKCNVFVGNWSIELKLKFKLLMSIVGSWNKLEQLFPYVGFRYKVEVVLRQLK